MYQYYSKKNCINPNTYIHADIIINNYMLKMSFHQAHISLNNVVADLTIPFTNELSEFTILLLKQSTYYVKVYRKMECLDLQTFRRHCYI